MEPYNDDDKFKFTDLDNLEIENSIKYLDVTQEKKDKLRNLFIQFQGLKKQALDKCKNSKDGKEIHGFYYNIIEVGKENKPEGKKEQKKVGKLKNISNYFYRIFSFLIMLILCVHIIFLVNYFHKEIPQWFYHHEIEEIIMTTFHYLKNLITPYINNIVL